MSEQHYIERYWRDATPADAIREPPMVARFRNVAGYNWFIGPLMGIRRDNNYPWYSTNIGSFEHCQVYDAPDPGEGYRLIDPEKDKPQEGDEIYERETRTWRRRLTPFQSSALSINRRRIEQPKPEPRYKPFSWEDREQLRGRWITYKHEDGTTIETQISHLSEHRREGFWFKSRNPVWLLENATFLDTGEPVGRRVE